MELASFIARLVSAQAQETFSITSGHSEGQRDLNGAVLLRCSLVLFLLCPLGKEMPRGSLLQGVCQVGKMLALGLGGS